LTHKNADPVNKQTFDWNAPGPGWGALNITMIIVQDRQALGANCYYQVFQKTLQEGAVTITTTNYYFYNYNNNHDRVHIKRSTISSRHRRRRSRRQCRRRRRRPHQCRQRPLQPLCRVHPAVLPIVHRILAFGPLVFVVIVVVV
jgi:hypothetical protein